MTPNDSFRRELGNGLIMRWSTAEDIEGIATLHAMVHRQSPEDPPNADYLTAIQALMNGDYPVMGPNDFGLIEDTSREGNPVVATTCLWQHTWAYEGIPFGVGRPEAVATDPAYRHRGLVRALFEMVHARSEARGDLVQAITGIAYFYRQFGYEYALELEDRRSTPLALIPQAKEGKSEPFSLREATAADIPEIERLYYRRQSSSIVWSLPTREQWLYEIETWKRHPELRHTLNFQMILNEFGQTIGFVACDAYRRDTTLGVWLLELAEGVNMQAVMPSLLRALQAIALSTGLAKPNQPALQELSFSLGTTHPIHEVLGDALDRPKEPPYAWYMRVKDLPGFLRHIAPALDKRLAASPMAGYTGEIKLDFYRGGLRLVFEHGSLRSAEDWRVPIYGSEGDAGFPPMVFWQVLFGHRSIGALRHIFPDIWVSHEAGLVLKALFPTRPSYVLAGN
ncbi:GNAT family N-acetyltransferase [Ktedonosporobacter rubrisoli]|uniref:GNAT family N-acetyltransferase n=1 Tax=Ktedonosporobacter rubrisoli TaxID=2509675 RepID=A0A4P6JJZ9_KTERU|nr:GNAT family N-acetyltransferase [Ktedonosporobacter rubrisoli]QBD75459.1 GNAT family N-acetyltransferase [Ktedonosporobacter rubrisoli]